MSKSTVRALLFLLLIVLVIWWFRSRRPPEVRLADHLGAICDIAERDVDHPSAGVDHLFAYLASDGPAMARDLGDLLVTIEAIRDDAAHDERARRAARAIHEPLVGCAAELERFGQAIQRDPEASAKLRRGVERLDRTLRILVGADLAKLGAPDPVRL